MLQRALHQKQGMWPSLNAATGQYMPPCKPCRWREDLLENLWTNRLFLCTHKVNWMQRQAHYFIYTTLVLRQHAHNGVGHMPGGRNIPCTHSMHHCLLSVKSGALEGEGRGMLALHSEREWMAQARGKAGFWEMPRARHLTGREQIAVEDRWINLSFLFPDSIPPSLIFLFLWHCTECNRSTLLEGDQRRSWMVELLSTCFKCGVSPTSLKI